MDWLFGMSEQLDIVRPESAVVAAGIAVLNVVSENASSRARSIFTSQKLNETPCKASGNGRSLR